MVLATGSILTILLHQTWRLTIHVAYVLCVLWCLALDGTDAWLPDTGAKLTHELGHTATVKFNGRNSSRPDHFTILGQDETSILLGGRNCVYNLSVFDFVERATVRLEWSSSEAHTQLCLLKGKTEDDCQNYIRIHYRASATTSAEQQSVVPASDTLHVCGTNSYKPLCRTYIQKNGKYIVEKEQDGIGVCPYDPEHNSTAVYSNNQLFSATVADFSGGDPLIYREPQRTELSDLKQLNAPNFVSSIPYGDYIFFFYRETAVEYINCGKVIYSRVARVCKNDKGGPHQFRFRWTSFLKTRLNCSVPGEYPFYFDEIQSTSNIVQGKYGSNLTTELIYGTLTTPSNAIGGSAICAYKVRDILEAFEGSFKQQDGINSNWLPVAKEKVPDPRPGQCARDSRILAENNVNFVKTHSLMEQAVPALFGKPLLIRVSLQYRFTAITVDAQVPALNGQNYDIIYVGTDDGRLLKVVNIPAIDATAARGLVISESIILPNGAAVKQLTIAPGYGKVIVVGRDEVRLATLNHCSTLQKCSDCVALQDPHCAWDPTTAKCISVDKSLRKSDLIQNILRGSDAKCGNPTDKRISPKIIIGELDNEIIPTIRASADAADDRLLTAPIINNPRQPSTVNLRGVDCTGDLAGNNINCAFDGSGDVLIDGAAAQPLVTYTADTLKLFVIICGVVTLVIGFAAGFIISRRLASGSHQAGFTTPFIEQHNHLDRLSGNQSNLIPARANKVVNVTQNSPPPKKDNLDASKDLNIASDGTLQKIKKTYL